MDRKDHVSWHRTIPFVKVQWNNHTEREATLELEEEMKVKHPELFEPTCMLISRTNFFLGGENVRATF